MGKWNFLGLEFIDEKDADWDDEPLNQTDDDNWDYSESDYDWDEEEEEQPGRPPMGGFV